MEEEIKQKFQDRFFNFYNRDFVVYDEKLKEEIVLNENKKEKIKEKNEICIFANFFLKNINDLNIVQVMRFFYFFSFFGEKIKSTKEFGKKFNLSVKLVKDSFFFNFTFFYFFFFYKREKSKIFMSSFFFFDEGMRISIRGLTEMSVKFLDYDFYNFNTSIKIDIKKKQKVTSFVYFSFFFSYYLQK